MRLVRALASAFIVIGLAGCDSAEERVEKHHQRGMALLAEEAPEKAVLEFRSALQIDENHAPSRLQIAKLYERDSKLRAAVGNYRLTIELDPDNFEANMRLARLLAAAGEAEQAAPYAEKSLALAPDDPDALATWAAVALRRGDPAAAVEAARKAIAADPDHLGANAVLISERVRAGETEAALSRLDELLAGAPDDATLNSLKLQVLSQANRPEALEAHLRRMVELFPETPALRRTLVQVLAQGGDVEGAEEQMRALATAAPGDAEIALDLVRFIRSARGEEAARAELEARVAATEGADRFPFVAALAELDYAAGRRDEARAAFEAVVADPGDAATARAAKLRLARMDIMEGATEEARARIEEIVAADADNAEALALRARLLIDEDRPGDAVIDLRKAIDLDPENPRLMMLAAEAHRRAGNAELAGERLAAAARASDFAPDISLAYAQFLVETDRLDAASSLLTEAFRRSPEDRGVLARLAALRLRQQDWAGAEEVAGAMRRLEGGDAAADQVIAAALIGRGEGEAGLELLETAAEGDAGGALRNLVSVYLSSGRFAEAVERVDAALADDPSDLQALVLRAELHRLAGEPDAARAALREAISARPESPTGYLGLAQLLMADGDLDGAEAIVKTGLEQTEEAPVLRVTLAQLLETRGDFNAAIDQYSILYERDSSSTIVANNLASLLAEHHADDPERMDLASRAAQRLRGSPVPAFQDTYGWILFLQGREEEALRPLIQAAEGLPDNPLVRYHAGRVYAALGQAEEARRHLEAALAATADFPKAESAKEVLASLPDPTEAQ